MLRGMPARKAILVLHGITMSGASMLRTLGPLGTRLSELGFELLAPNAAHRMPSHEIAELRAGLEPLFAKQRSDIADWFSVGRFWDEGEHFDWLASTTDASAGTKTYRALDASLATIADAARSKNVVGVLGFSQGAAMATIVVARAAQGDPRFAMLRFAVFLSGFKPVFTAPEPPVYPVRTTLARLFVAGDRDPIFPGTAEYVASLGAAFEGGSAEQLLIEGLGHDVPSDPDDIERMVAFVARHVEDDESAHPRLPR